MDQEQGDLSQGQGTNSKSLGQCDVALVEGVGNFDETKVDQYEMENSIGSRVSFGNIKISKTPDQTQFEVSDEKLTQNGNHENTNRSVGETPSSEKMREESMGPLDDKFATLEDKLDSVFKHTSKAVCSHCNLPLYSAKSQQKTRSFRCRHKLHYGCIIGYFGREKIECMACDDWKGSKMEGFLRDNCIQN